jgi:hypothetical protein
MAIKHKAFKQSFANGWRNGWGRKNPIDCRGRTQICSLKNLADLYNKQKGFVIYRLVLKKVLL